MGGGGVLPAAPRRPAFAEGRHLPGGQGLQHRPAVGIYRPAPLFQGPRQQAGVGAQGGLRLRPGQSLRLPAGLQHLHGGEQAQSGAVLQL
ncbi:hypothetical protein SDC9_160012 [bioreactor metagenome]|uniref:Uncharacterized protein n=1 Tax=bioreactor metagenome TaxID=1076179 RepID=A0A645FKG3_9ZZZZ